MINHDCYRSHLEQNKKTPAGEGTENCGLHAGIHDIIWNFTDANEPGGKGKCHTVHPINMTSTAFWSQKEPARVYQRET